MATVSRVQILPVPVAEPGVCALCGSGNKPVIDFGKQLDWYGAVYFCVADCMRELAESMGYVPVCNFDGLHNSHRELQIKYDQLQAEYKDVKNALTRLLSSDNESNSSNSDTPDVEFSIPEIPDFSNETDDGSVPGDIKTEQSDSVEGSDDLFDDSDFESA
jgi:hypothetical protein